MSRPIVRFMSGWYGKREILVVYVDCDKVGGVQFSRACYSGVKRGQRLYDGGVVLDQ